MAASKPGKKFKSSNLNTLLGAPKEAPANYGPAVRSSHVIKPVAKPKGLVSLGKASSNVTARKGAAWSQLEEKGKKEQEKLKVDDGPEWAVIDYRDLEKPLAADEETDEKARDDDLAGDDIYVSEAGPDVNGVEEMRVQQVAVPGTGWGAEKAPPAIPPPSMPAGPPPPSCPPPPAPSSVRQAPVPGPPRQEMAPPSPYPSSPVEMAPPSPYASPSPPAEMAPRSPYNTSAAPPTEMAPPSPYANSSTAGPPRPTGPPPPMPRPAGPPPGPAPPPPPAVPKATQQTEAATSLAPPPQSFLPQPCADAIVTPSHDISWRSAGVGSERGGNRFSTQVGSWTSKQPGLMAPSEQKKAPPPHQQSPPPAQVPPPRAPRVLHMQQDVHVKEADEAAKKVEKAAKVEKPEKPGKVQQEKPVKAPKPARQPLEALDPESSSADGSEEDSDRPGEHAVLDITVPRTALVINVSHVLKRLNGCCSLNQLTKSLKSFKEKTGVTLEQFLRANPTTFKLEGRIVYLVDRDGEKWKAPPETSNENGWHGSSYKGSGGGGSRGKGGYKGKGRSEGREGGKGRSEARDNGHSYNGHSYSARENGHNYSDDYNYESSHRRNNKKSSGNDWWSASRYEWDAGHTSLYRSEAV